MRWSIRIITQVGKRWRWKWFMQRCGSWWRWSDNLKSLKLSYSWFSRSWWQWLPLLSIGRSADCQAKRQQHLSQSYWQTDRRVAETYSRRFALLALFVHMFVQQVMPVITGGAQSETSSRRLLHSMTDEWHVKYLFVPSSLLIPESIRRPVYVKIYVDIHRGAHKYAPLSAAEGRGIPIISSEQRNFNFRMIIFRNNWKEGKAAHAFDDWKIMFAFAASLLSFFLHVVFILFHSWCSSRLLCPSRGSFATFDITITLLLPLWS